MALYLFTTAVSSAIGEAFNRESLLRHNVVSQI